jgi:phosphodiesterase/alkaline phosphatase D-like protein
MNSRFSTTIVFRIFFTHLLVFCLYATAIAQTEPSGILLTWQQDPTTTISIDWHTLPADQANNTLAYRKKNDTNWKQLQSNQYPFPHSDRSIHRIEITGLDPNSNYEFRVGEFKRIYSFHTLPTTNDRAIRFASGGDTSHGEMFGQMNRAVMPYDLDFIVWGGDLAYANGDKENVGLWYQWF